LAAELKTRPSAPGNGTATIVIGDNHARLVREARDAARKGIVVASHKFGNAGENAVIAPLLRALRKDPNLKIELFYGEPSGKKSGADVSEIVVGASALGASVKPVLRPTLHAKFLSWDNDYLVVTSQNWLSADTPENNPLQEIGVFIRSPSVARLFMDRFRLRTSAH
jgi:cardiolipin synthase